ncbi:disease resistance protein RPM1-like [Panicum miliaceum]|uniref:Disease resistance protein RPM1-like n=1 Tax=Panicum miliaceum TaxID=4540 RepID=A0A3L6QT00_PANMI|nr:disease resistance protein RPM1-like [Panicum miliaceum]
MEATAVSLARSVLDGVLSSAGTAVADEVARLAGVPKEVEFIRNELEMMRSFLKVASAHPEAAVRNDTVRTWVKQVRDLAYDVEDCLLDFALYADRASSSRAGYWLAPGAVAARHRIAARIRDLKARVEELNQRNLRYHVVVGSPAAPRGGEEQPPVLPDHDAQSAELAFQASADVVGRGREKAQLTELISGSNGAVGVVSVWGMGGMGKSSLVRMVHNDPVLLDEFDCDAWITVPHPLDGAEVFRRRLRKELGLARDQSVPEYLQEKRYLVIVDDLHSQEEWENICQVFHHQSENRKGSRIIVTTRREDVARHCAGHVAGWDGHVYELKPLGDGESMDLLCQKIYKTTDYVCPTDMEDQARRILRRCRGLPLAISTIGGLLANRPKTSIEWRNLHEHLGAELESDLRNITKVIVSSYDGLPYHLKSIFLYLSIFPENHEIRRTRLLRRWMAEGHIAKNRDMPVEDVGERFYSELINRSMIQPSKANPGVRADRCQNLRYLETLDIEDTHVRELPSGVAKLEKLHYLLSGVSFTKDLLQKMGESGKVSYKTSLFGNIGACLCCNRSECCKVFNVDQFSVRAPEGIEKLKNLHMLGLINVGRGNGVAGRLKNLTNLTNLRRLGVTGLSEKEGQELCESMGELKRLQRLEVRSDSLKFLTRMDQEAPNPPRMLRRLVSLRLCGDLSNMPRWISSLNDLAKVKLLGTRLKQGDIEHLQNLRNLALLGLWENSYMDKLLHFCSGTFPKLKFLDIDGLKEIETVTIVKGAMPELEQLWVNKCPSLHDDSSGLSGVPHLLKLNELLLKNCGEKEKLINTLQAQVNRHIRRPKFLIGKSIAPTSPTKGTITTIEQ